MERLIAIGDVHGCFKTLRTLLEEQVKPVQTDTLIFLGDYIDRGPGSKQVIDYIMHLQEQGLRTILLRGNHEQTLLDALHYEKERKGWFTSSKNNIFNSWYEKFGGRETFQSYGISSIKDFPQNHEIWLSDLKFYHKTDHYFFVHAGFNFSEADILSDTDSMLWIREFDYDASKAGNRKIVHGHVPVTLEFLKECIAHKNLGFIPLDTGCVYKEKPGMGYLSAFDLTNQALFFLKNIG